jgi:hypothetical protein
MAIAKSAGIIESPTSGMFQRHSNRSLGGGDIEDIVNSSGIKGLATVMEDVVVCYRTSPRHKLHIIRALQARGHFVAMTGHILKNQKSEIFKRFSVFEFMSHYTSLFQDCPYFDFRIENWIGN